MQFYCKNTEERYFRRYIKEWKKNKYRERAINAEQFNKVKEDLTKAKQELAKVQLDYETVLVKKSIVDYPYATKELLMNHAKSIGKLQ